MADTLITKLDGSANPDTPRYDAVVYLDSSARPVSWMVKGLWDFAARKDEQGTPVTMPLTLFANIDGRRTGKSVSPERSASLRQAHTSLASWDEANTPKRVLIIDEIAVSGDTLDIAQIQFEAAFPNIEFTCEPWKDERNVPDKERDNVRWYERTRDLYRAVLDSKELTSSQQAELAKRGITPKNTWLTTPNPQQEGVKKLRAEIDLMAKQVIAGEMPYWPSKQRPDDQFIALVSEHNDDLNSRQFANFREWMKRYYAPIPLANLITTDKNGPLSEKEARGYLQTLVRYKSKPVPAPPILDDATKAYARKFGYL